MFAKHSTVLYNYANTSTQYRQGDETGYDHFSLSYFRSRIQVMTESMNRPLHVLDLGCGTGRYFHCYRNAQTITGIDLSLAMLEQAQDPHRKEEITAHTTTLIQSDLHAIGFPPHSFDCIISIGVFGLYAPLTEAFCRKIWRWLRPSGHLLLQVQDAATPRQRSWKRLMAMSLQPTLPRSLRWRLAHHLQEFAVTEPFLRNLCSRTHIPHTNLVRCQDVDPQHRYWRRWWFLLQADKPE